MAEKNLPIPTAEYFQLTWFWHIPRGTAKMSYKLRLLIHSYNRSWKHGQESYFSQTTEIVLMLVCKRFRNNHRIRSAPEVALSVSTTLLSKTCTFTNIIPIPLTFQAYKEKGRWLTCLLKQKLKLGWEWPVKLWLNVLSIDRRILAGIWWSSSTQKSPFRHVL